MKDSFMLSYTDDELSSYSDEAWYRACTLRERLAPGLPQLVPTDEDRQANWRLQRWKNERPYQHGIDFHKRLAEDDLTENGLFALLQEKASLLQARLTKSAWMTELERTLLSADRIALSEFLRQAGATVGPEIRCIDAFSPLINAGITRLREAIQALADRYPSLPFASERVLLLLLPGLLSTFLTCSLKVFTLELHVARLQGKLSGRTSEERFDEFVNMLLCQDQLSILLAEYPVLARQLQLAADFWVSNSLEMFERLCADWPELCALFAVDGDPGQLSEITGGVGDTHCGGHTVTALRFSSGLRLVYKPRFLMVDMHFQELLRWLNERGDHPPFRLINLMVRERYGWSEFIQAESCASVAEVERFYERLGAYLAVLYVLDATDFHFENLIAAGEQPMLIDLEALFHPRIGSSDNIPLPLQPFQRSVMRVGLLPGRVFSKNEYAGLEVSGVGGYGGQQSLYPVAQWKKLNTDEMHLVREHTTLAGQHNRPRLQGEEVDVLDYNQAIMRGFASMYRLLMREREALIAGPLQRFASDEVRLVVRPTAYYTQLLQESFHPDLLHDALDHERYFDNLWLATRQQPYLESFIQAERSDLWSGDIPLFRTTPGTCTALSSDGECIDGGFEEPSLEVVKRIIEELDEADLRRQCWFIEASMATMLLGKSPQRWRNAVLEHPSHQESTRERLLQEACVIADHICNMALFEGDSANWIGLSMVNDTQWSLTPLTPELYNGIPGIVLFLAYLGKITSVSRYINVAQAGLNCLHIQMEQAEQTLKLIGGFGGWGSLLYLYTHLAVLWNEPSYYHRAEQVVTRIGQLVEHDEVLDVIAGSAGAILALASLNQVVPSANNLAVALQCGEHLLTRAIPALTGIGWARKPEQEKPLTGFSHGAAGFSYSLMVLAEWSKDSRFKEAALAAMAYERATFSPATGTWPNLLLPTSGIGEIQGSEGQMCVWCHGAAGIGMGRLASLRYLDTAEMREEIAIALEQVEKTGFMMNHSLCHGSLGNLDALLIAARILDDPAYEQKVRLYGGLILDTFPQNGWLTGVPLSVESPGLMTGLAGIGYQLLRLAEPELVPSVLLLAAPPGQW